MLTFITGRASSGKTYETINHAIKSAKSGKKVIILVPEQFSFECEKKVLSALGDTMAQNISVLSFSRICDEVDRVTGGVCSRPLNNSDIQILMKKAIGDCADNLTSFKRFKNIVCWRARPGWVCFFFSSPEWEKRQTPLISFF